jgi:CheY-like chemotaxis protein
MKIESGRRPATILIVEDVGWIRAGMKRSVERYGHRAVAAEDDAEALALAGREPPELILTEEKLPTFGLLMARLREHPTLHAVPVVIINPDAEDGELYDGCILLTDYDHNSRVLISTPGPANS